MLFKSANNKKYIIILIILISVNYSECKRSRNGGGRRTTPRSHQHHTTRRYENKPHTTPSNIGFDRITPAPNQHSIGFENVQQRIPPQNNQPHQQTHAHPVGNPPGPAIGFENVQNRVPPQNNQPIHQTNYHPVGNQPGPGVGFPPQSNQPQYSYPQQHYPGAQSNQPPQGYPQQHYPGVQGNQPQHSYPQQNYPGGYHGNNYQNPGNYPGGYPGNNYPPPNLYQPSGNYYHQHFGPPGGPPPQIYQPQKSSHLGTALGIAGGLGAGYLIGRLTSGNGGHGSDDNKYTVHHYYQNANEIPKEMKVSDNSLVNCTQNSTQNLCVPNTFPICLANATIMCVTHSQYTTSCGTNSTMVCVVTVLPCAGNDSSCNTAGNSTTMAVYIPCISNITISKQKAEERTSDAPLNNNFSDTNVELCVTAIAEPKYTETLTSSYLAFISQLAMMPIEASQMANISFNSTEKSNTIIYDSITTPLPVTT